ncbi:MAG TPA: FAD-binding protein [Polyangiaceae bacterium]|jgi:FAD/FMN-containing dehydrogenase
MIARRQFLVGVGAGLGGAAVLGFDPTTRSWITEARASSPFDHVPPLDGVLLFDPASLAADAVDVGNIVHETPIAVLRPGSVDDIRKMIRFCRPLRIGVSARGQGHTTFGQAQVEAGLVIEMSSLATVHSIEPTRADVDAGVLWKDLLETIVPQGLTPPALTGFTGLSFGGTLSVGGISSNFAAGAQVDYVRELEVVTGEGDVVRCSAERHRDLFEVALAGLGQCAIITRMVVDLVPALPLVRLYQVPYADGATFFRDFRTLLQREEVDEAFNLGIPNGSGGFGYQLNVVKYFDPSSPPDADRLLRGLSFSPSSSAVTVTDIPYLSYLLRVDAAVDLFKQIGLWDGVLHPWFDVFLPGRAVERFVVDVTDGLTADDVGATGFLLLFAKKTRNFTRPFLRVPRQDEWFFLFDILTANAAPGPDPAFQARMLERNRRLFEKARRVGGTRYPIGSVTFDHRDWVIQYGDEWPRFFGLKQQFDPDGILTRGPGIF